MGLISLSWEIIDNHHLEKKFGFPDFVSALEFVNIAGDVCESQNHHAEFVLSWGTVTIKIWTHDTNSITELDYELAKGIDEVFSDGP